MKLLKGVLITVGVLMILSSAGTSDFESIYHTTDPHSMLQIALLAVGGILIAFIGYKLPTRGNKNRDYYN